MNEPRDHFDGGLADAHARLSRELAVLQLQEATAVRLRELLQIPAFHDICKALEEEVDVQVRALMTRRMDDYQLGERQGYIRGLRILSNTKPMSDDELSHIRDELIPALRQKLDTVTNLIGSSQRSDDAGRHEWREGV